MKQQVLQLTGMEQSQMLQFSCFTGLEIVCVCVASGQNGFPQCWYSTLSTDAHLIVTKALGESARKNTSNRGGDGFIHPSLDIWVPATNYPSNILSYIL